MKVAAFELASGKTIIAEVDDEDEDMFIVRNPMEMVLTMDSVGSVSFRFIRWLPFNDMNQALINKSMVQGMSTMSEEMSTMYKTKITQLQHTKDVIKELKETSEQPSHSWLH